MPRLSNQKWANARKAWETQGTSVKALAEKYGVSVTTVQKHKQVEGWSRDGQPDPRGGGFAEAAQAGFAPEQRVTIEPSSTELKLREQVKVLEDKLVAAEEEVQEHRPYVDLPVYETVEQVVELFGQEFLENTAGIKLNAKRIAQGFVSIDFKPGDERLQKAVEEEAQDIVDAQTKYGDSSNQRTVKLALRDRRFPSGYRTVAWAVEPQISNEAGQPGASLWKMRDKGFKLIEPYRCQRQNCWAPAARDGQRNLLHNGYCGALHEQGDPFLKGRVVEGVSKSRAMVSPGGVDPAMRAQREAFGIVGV